MVRIVDMGRSPMRDAIARSLISLMRDNSFDSISITDLATEADCNRSTFYRNFSSKEEVLRYRILMVMDDYILRYDEGSNKSFKGYLESIFMSIKDNAEVFSLSMRDDLDMQISEAIRTHFDEEYEINRLSLEDRYAMAFHIGGIAGHIRLWIEQGFSETAEDMARIVSESYPAGFAPIRLRLKAYASNETRAYGENG